MKEDRSVSYDNELFDPLSDAAKEAFALADAVRQRLNHREVEIAHLLYGLYRKHGTAARKTMNSAGIGDDNVLEALGLPPAVADINAGSPLTALPPLAAHASKALAVAAQTMKDRGNTEILSRYLFDGVLKCSECSLVRKLKTQYRLDFNLDEYERLKDNDKAPAKEASTTSRREDREEPPAVEPTSDPVLAAQIRQTSIFVHDTQTPWSRPADAFALFCDSEFHPQGIYAERLEKDLGSEGWVTLLTAIDKARSESYSDAIASVLFITTPDPLRDRLPGVVMVSEPNPGSEDQAPGGKVTTLLRDAANRGLSRVTLPLAAQHEYGPHEITVGDETAGVIAALRGASGEYGVLQKLSSVTLCVVGAKPAKEAIDGVTSALDRDTWNRMSETLKAGIGWAAAVAGEEDGLQQPITPLHLLGGLCFGSAGNASTTAGYFLRSALVAALSPAVDSQDGPLNRVASLIEVPMTATPLALESLPPLTEDAREALDAAISLKPEVRQGIHSRDLAAGLLLTTQPDRLPPAAAELKKRGFDLSHFADQFLAYIKDGAPDELEHWTVLIRDAARRALAAPIRANIDNDEVHGAIKPEDDRLKIANEVDRFARLLVAQDVKPPISVGLFGNWGSGKTFFMGLLKSRIIELAQDKETASYVANVAQIDFNAWHYVDTNLWASLAMRIFDGLTHELGFEVGSDIEETRRKLHSGIESSKKIRERAGQEQKTAKEKRAQASKLLAERQLKRSALAEKQRVKRAIRVWGQLLKDDAFKDETEELQKIARQFGLSDALNSIDDSRRLFEELRSIRSRATGLASAVSARFSGGKKTLVTIAIIVLAVAVARALGSGVDALRQSADWLKSILPQASVVQVASLVSATVAWAGGRAASISRGLRKLESLQGRLQEADAESSVPEDERKLQRVIETLDSDIQKKTETIAEADRRIAEAETELQRINQGGLVYDFLKDRRSSSRYQDQLGLISTIRGDFERLRELLDDLARNGTRPIGRIILYIDDLDRCNPNQVVDVLQAVHLLLAFDLFSVVVGVDARWLERSLCRAYLGSGARSSMTPGSRTGSQAFSAQNYLEKIFQIPYSLKHMSDDGFKELVGHLVTTRTEHERKVAGNGQAPQPEPHDVHQGVVRQVNPDETTSVAVAAAERNTTQLSLGSIGPDGKRLDRPDDPGKRVGQRSDDSEKKDNAPPVDAKKAIEALFLEDWEEQYMQTLHKFIPTPRLAKRFVNVYRLLRVKATERDFETFIGNGSDGEHRAVLLLLAINIGFPTVGPVVLRVLAEQVQITSWSLFLEQIDPEIPREKRQPWAKDLVWSTDQKAEFARLKSVLSTLSGAPAQLAPYSTWAEEVGRYSFQWHIAH